MNLVEPGYGTFTNQERARLSVYRAAVAAGFFTDWDGSTETTDTELLAWLLTKTVNGSPSDETRAFPFTAGELRRLEQCRAAVAAGYYSEN
jgi:hypothetical protein